MQKPAWSAFVALGGMGILNYDETTLLIDTEDYPKEYIPVGNEHRKAYEYLNNSGIARTFVCSPDIINADATGRIYYQRQLSAPISLRSMQATWPVHAGWSE